MATNNRGRSAPRERTASFKNFGVGVTGLFRPDGTPAPGRTFPVRLDPPGPMVIYPEDESRDGAQPPGSGK